MVIHHNIVSNICRLNLPSFFPFHLPLGSIYTHFNQVTNRRQKALLLKVLRFSQYGFYMKEQSYGALDGKMSFLCHKPSPILLCRILNYRENLPQIESNGDLASICIAEDHFVFGKCVIVCLAEMELDLSQGNRDITRSTYLRHFYSSISVFIKLLHKFFTKSHFVSRGKCLKMKVHEW